MRDHLQCGMSLDHLAGYADGTLPPEDAQRVRTHAEAGCESCAETLIWLLPLLDRLRGAGRIVPPAYSLDPVKALFRERMRTPKRRPLLARLVADSRLTRAYGLRGGGPEAFNLVYSTAEHDVDIWSEPQEDGSWYLIGQALPRDGSPPSVPDYAALVRSTAVELPLRMDGAEFHGSGLLSGIYDLKLGLSDGEIVAPQIRIGA